MNRTLLLFVLMNAPAAFAADAAKPPACIPPADYVPGVDATGRAVAPADLNGQPPPDLGSITVAPRIAIPHNPVIKDAQIVVDLKKQTPANCPLQALPPKR